MMLKLSTSGDKGAVSMRVEKAVPPTHRTLKHQCGYFLTHPRMFAQVMFELCLSVNNTEKIPFLI